MHIGEETERLKQNLMGIDGENGGDDLKADIPDKREDDQGNTYWVE